MASAFLIYTGGIAPVPKASQVELVHFELSPAGVLVKHRFGLHELKAAFCVQLFRDGVLSENVQPHRLFAVYSCVLQDFFHHALSDALALLCRPNTQCVRDQHLVIPAAQTPGNAGVALIGLAVENGAGV